MLISLKTSVQSRFLIDDGGPKTWDIRAGYSDVSGGTINFNAVSGLPGFTFLGTSGADQFFKDVNTHDFKYMFNVPPVNEQETTNLSIKMDNELEDGTYYRNRFI